MLSERYKNTVRHVLDMYHDLLKDQADRARGILPTTINIEYVELLEVYGLAPPRKQHKVAIADGISGKVMQFADIVAGMTEQAISATADAVEEIAEQPVEQTNIKNVTVLVTK